MFKNIVDSAKKLAKDVADTVSENTPDSVKNAVAKGADLASDAFDKGKELAGDAYEYATDEKDFLVACRKNREFVELCFLNKGWIEDQLIEKE